MSEPQIRIEPRSTQDSSKDDVEMTQTTEAEAPADTELEAPTGEAEAEADEVVAEASALEDPQQSFLSYLQSPIVELGIGQGDEEVTLTAHSGILARSPFFKDALSQFSEDVTMRRIDMPKDDMNAMACFLQFMYTGEYYPRRMGDRLEQDKDDDDGEELLKHARVYTLAEKLKVQDLADLALSKVHRVSATAQGEIQYARYVYGNTDKTNQRIRKPVASYWGARSHVLRHEAEDSFKELCMEYPEFAYDVLTQVLDSRERRGEKERDSEVPKSARKRQRQI